eukprot:TRINITY_DN11288_c0_g2_i2.p1 TRINITY_DN11288_c0_g2~~TRINITY_DN11288_c0_g2_i2.p1  ORF type:complete len:152 (+),score=23.64 TRINITY_DN11288_c0_g2_i2:125-580(+)
MEDDQKGLTFQSFYKNGYPELWEKVKTIRKIAFMDEHKVPAKLEFDEHDDLAVHFLLFQDDIPVGCARLTRRGDDWYMGRLAIIRSQRGRGLGTFMIRKMIECCKERGIPSIIISSLAHLKVIYKKLGFVEFGEEFEQAGLQLIHMRYDIV